ncbi:MAG: succinyl-diaminopimelate desuccinylase [Actinomycetota bacterium]
MSLLDEALALVKIDSLSRNEKSLADEVEHRLSKVGHLQVSRIENNVVARTVGAHTNRAIVAGHLDTVPGHLEKAGISGSVLTGLGAVDMKGSLAVMLELAKVVPTKQEITWVFYAKEEIARSESGLHEIHGPHPELLEGSVAILCEPTGGSVEAGCQGSIRFSIALRGERAHASRPFTGRNAIHRMGDIVKRIADFEPRVVAVDDIEYVEQLQVVSVDGGIAANVVPDLATMVVNHRVAPDRTLDEAITWFKNYIGDLLEPEDGFRVEDAASPSAPGLHNKQLQELVALTGREPRAKVGWTDVATFVDMGIPATNFGAGDPLLAHHSDERVSLAELETFAAVLRAWLF